MQLTESHPYHAPREPAFGHRQRLGSISTGDAVEHAPLQLQKFWVAERLKEPLELVIFGVVKRLGRP
jgi:hypothetical protein